MPLERARRAVEWVYDRAPPNEELNFGFFGGEPLVEFPLIESVTELIESHPKYDRERVRLTIVTNGTIFNQRIARFVRDHGIGFGISCDGPPEVHDRFRRYPNGRGSSAKVERTIKEALANFANVMVNAVYRPETLDALPETVEYFSELGVRQIYLSPDYSAEWSAEHVGKLDSSYAQVGRQYVDYIRRGDPHFISLIDGKIATVLRGGYQPEDRCRMGRGELAITPEGSVYPCERLVGSGSCDTTHRLGSVEHGIELKRMDRHLGSGETDSVCARCSLRDYCMHWCGCSNYFGTGHYDRVSPFLCASEKAAIRTAVNIYQTLEQEKEGLFYDHASGSPLMNSIGCRSHCGN